MTPVPTLDRARVRELFDLRSPAFTMMGGGYRDDPYPAWHRLREQAAVHPGIVHELTGFAGPALFAGLPYPDRPHFSAFSYEACAAAFRDPEVFASSPEPKDAIEGEVAATNSMLSMGGERHRRYRALVQPSFGLGRVRWWLENWVQDAVHLMIDGFAGTGRAELNVDFAAAIPVLTITGSFGVPVGEALEIRAAMRQPDELIRRLAPIVAARRAEPQDDLISVLVQAELTEDDGSTHRLTDDEIHSFTVLLLMAGSGTTWKQMGITLTALLRHPEALAAVRADRTLLDAAIHESVRWAPTDPMFSRYVTRDTELAGVALPAGAVLHLCLGAANRDPARWDDPDAFDIARKLRPGLGFGGGPHICLGMHLARAEMRVGIGALLDRLPGLRLDPEAEPPALIGMYERGATEIPVLFEAAS